ncbi:MerR family transcriptional regulator [Sphingomonas sp. VNH70]|uniref:MerR family transcriptional regulator n=1 Tax=Sphingomonas silueang TaxID=3156617 RepID=UPI0032B43A99
MAGKSATAYRTIGEVARDLGVPQHRLRYWESRFPQVKPVTRAGDRRYYAPEDVALLRRIHALLGEEGYTVRGVQALLAREAEPVPPSRVDALRAIRTMLADALRADG